MTKKNIYGAVLAIFLFILVSLGCDPVAASDSGVQVRDDGLTVVKIDRNDHDPFDYVVMILKAGYAHDSPEKAGLVDLTNEIIAYTLANTVALEVYYSTYAHYTVFQFTVLPSEYRKFCSQLDTVIRQDVILQNRLCNQIIQYHLNLPENPSALAVKNLYQMLYGPEHPYLNTINRKYEGLNLTDVNNCFRKIYRPNNLIIAGTQKLPVSFLREPTGRDLGTPVVLTADVENIAPSEQNYEFTPTNDKLVTVAMGFRGSSLKDEEFFPTLMMLRIMEDELRERLREELGLIYHVEVGYSYLTAKSNPAFVVYFQVLPEDAERALKEAVAVWRSLAGEAITPERLAHIAEVEENRHRFQYKFTTYRLERAGLAQYWEKEWIGDPDSYLAGFSQVTREQIWGVIRTVLPGLKISVAGPSAERLVTVDDQVAALLGGCLQ